MGAQNSKSNGRSQMTNITQDYADDLRDWRLTMDSSYPDLDWSKIASQREIVEYCSTLKNSLDFDLKQYRLVDNKQDCIIKIQSIQLAWLFLNSVQTVNSFSPISGVAWAKGVRAPMNQFFRFYQINPVKLTQFWKNSGDLPDSIDAENVSFHSALSWLINQSGKKIKADQKVLILESFDQSVNNLKRKSQIDLAISQDQVR